MISSLKTFSTFKDNLLNVFCTLSFSNIKEFYNREPTSAAFCIIHHLSIEPSFSMELK